MGLSLFAEHKGKRSQDQQRSNEPLGILPCISLPAYPPPPPTQPSSSPHQPTQAAFYPSITTATVTARTKVLLSLPGIGARGCQSRCLPEPARAIRRRWASPAKEQKDQSGRQSPHQGVLRELLLRELRAGSGKPMGHWEAWMLH